jgi:hypothetical protein
MNWKEENKRERYIDEITDEEAYLIAHLALGRPKYDFEVVEVKRECNGNNIPHVTIRCKYVDSIIFEDVETVIGIFDNLNIYHDVCGDGNDFSSVYCQKEIFEEFKKMNLC